MPTELHLALQRHYAGDTGLIEAAVDGGYRADVLRDGVVYEIQTGSFGALRGKLLAIAPVHDVVVVYPLTTRKTIVRLHPISGLPVSSRLSPRRGTMADLFEHLVHVASVFVDERVWLEVVLVHERELRCADGKGGWRRDGVSRVGRELVEVVDTQRFGCPADFLRLLPEGLTDPFTMMELAEMAGIRKRLAGKMAYALHRVGALARVGKSGNAYLYVRATPPVTAVAGPGPSAHSSATQTAP